MKLICNAAFAALLMAGAVAGSTAAPDAAIAYQSHNSDQHASDDNYDEDEHGPRYRERRPGYTYQFAGYWYSKAWWVPVRTDSDDAGDLSHAEWCFEQYGEYYNADSDTYGASDGRSYRCIRPGHR